MFAKIKKDKVACVDRIVEVINENNITGYEIAKNTSISEVAAIRIIKGSTSNPNDSTLSAIVDYLGVAYSISQDWLISGKGSKKVEVVPDIEKFDRLSEEEKSRKIEETALFVAFQEERLMKHPVFSNIVKRRVYELMLEMTKEKRV